MKKQLSLTILFILVAFTAIAQTLNQPANWPNVNWSLTGNYDNDHLDANPTLDTSFSFDDDDAGSSSINAIAAESPVIDLTAASNAGENTIVVTFDFVYRIFQAETLNLQYWDDDNSTWVTFGDDLAQNSGLSNNFCTGNFVPFSSEGLNINAFSANQLQNFRYRIFYDDNTSWGYGFCINSPIITSQLPPLCPNVSGLTVDNIGATSVDVSWTAGGTETTWEVAVVPAGDPTPSSGTLVTTIPYTITGLNQLTDYIVYIRADCGTDGVSTWSNASFTTGFDDSNYPVTFTQSNFPTNGVYDRAIVDMNGDYLDDIVSVSNNNINIHFQNNSGGFTEENFPTTNADNLPSWSLAAGDIDGNGFNDLLYGGGSGVTFMQANDTGTAFTEISGPDFVFSQRSNFIDIDNDGNLDAFVCHDIDPNVYYINDGSGNLTFYQGQSAELPNGIGLTPGGGNYGTVWIDYDNDRDMDLFIAKCRGGNTLISINELWRNDGNGVFVNVADSSGWYDSNYPGVGHDNSSNLGDAIQTWSSAWADFDNDGDMDVYVGASSSSNGLSKLMENNGDGTFTDITAGSGVLNANMGIENAPADFDNDGFVDILSNGDILFNNGDFTFTNFSVNMPSSGSIGDVNNDGFLDVFNGNLFLNDTNSNNWLKIITVGTESNLNGIGARVEITTPSGTQIRDVRSGEGFRYMSSLNTHFGLGTDSTITNITVYWPSGIIDNVSNPSINSTLTIVEGETLSIPDESLSDLAIYPNPVKDMLYIKTKGNVVDKVASVFDINGKLIFSHKLTNDTLDVSKLNSGIYFLRLESQGKTMRKKFIKL
ncbi:MAG: FG-GAP-like repeat-containing protein [Bacteroidota bacterium]